MLFRKIRGAPQMYLWREALVGRKLQV